MLSYCGLLWEKLGNLAANYDYAQIPTGVTMLVILSIIAGVIVAGVIVGLVIVGLVINGLILYHLLSSTAKRAFGCL
jgi:hypothetical protein